MHPHRATDDFRSLALRPLLALYAIGSATFGAALLPASCWPLAAAFCCAMAGTLAWALRAPDTGHCRDAAGCVVLVMGMAGFLLCFSLRASDASWHPMAFCALLLAPYGGITQRMLCGAGLGIAASVAWLCLQDGMPAGSATTLLALNLGGIGAAHGQRRQRNEQDKALALLADQAVRDHLTGCYNRRYLDEHLLGTELARSQRHGLCLTAIMCDLAHFKRINDAHGHARGDEVLRIFAGLLGNAIRRGIDSVVRHGGEEFLLILPETDLAGGVRLAERLRASLPRHIATTASFGVASIHFTPGGRHLNAATLIAAADTQLYQAKRAGRDCVKAAMLRADTPQAATL